MSRSSAARIYLAAIAALTLLSGAAERTSNSFFTIEGEGVRIASDGGVCVDAGASGPVTLTARSGWLVNGRESIVYPSPKGLSSGLILTSKLGEDHSCSPPPPTEKEEHITNFVFKVESNPTNLIAMYALPATSVAMTVTAHDVLLEAGRHRVMKIWKAWECSVCGAKQEGRTNVSERATAPDAWTWAAAAAGRTFPTNVWSGPMSKGLGQKIEFTATGKWSPCSKCKYTTNAVVRADIHELSIKRPDYLGLDRTDAGLSGWAVTNATARIDPEPTSATYNWTSCGKCQFVGATNEQKVTYGITNSATASTKFRAEDLKVRATASNADGLSASATCTTNFTVVAVDVTIGSVGEDKEESEGAFIPYVADATNGVISVEGTNKLVLVRLSCEPGNLPTNEMVRVLCAGPAGLYQKLSDGELVRVVSTNYFANEISNLEFVLHGHAASGSCKDGEIQIEHPTSGAVDVAKYTSVKVNVEITGFPTKTLLGEDKEEMPGAFIPYASDWAYGETPSNEDDIPFGPSAQEKLVDVYVSYEPSDLPEHEDGGGKFLVFEAPSDSLYLPANSAGSDQLWMEFVDWWNTRPASWSLSFEGRKRLRLHGHEKSNSQRDREIRITHPKSGATDVAKYTVYHVDLDIDSDNDLAIENEDGFEDAIEEREPGKIISWDQSGISPGQDYRVPLRLNAWGGETNAVVRLEAVASSARVAEIYRTEAGGNKLDLPFYLPADSIPPLYVDGVTNGTISITATLINPPEGVSVASSVRPIPGLELAKDKVAALVIQPISFAPGRGKHAGVWVSDPCMDQPGNTNRAMRTANRFASVATSVGFTFVDHEEWCVDITDGYDDNPGDLTLERFKKMADCGLVLFKGHGRQGVNIPVLFTDTPQGMAAANRWCAGESGMRVAVCTLYNNRTFQGVWCYSAWYAANWKPRLNNGDAIVYWLSCHSADGASSIEHSAGGRWRISWGAGGVGNGTVNDVEAANAVRGTLGVMSENPSARSASLALETGTARAFMAATCKTDGNPWTTLCPGPIPSAGHFPREVLKKNIPALGCMILDTFIDDEWSPADLVKTSCGETVDGDISPCWLRQEGCNRPFGVVFRIYKLSDQAVEVTASHRLIRNSGAYYNDLPFIKTGIDEVDHPAWDSNAPGRALDEDGIAPNDNDMTWRY